MVEGFVVNVWDATVTAVEMDAASQTVTVTFTVPASDVAVDMRPVTRLVRKEP